MAKLYIKKNEERRLALGHQWIFSNEIERVEELNKNGEVVDLYTYNYKYLGKGFYNKHSLIAYRHLTDFKEDIDRKFLYKRINNANAQRKKVNRENNIYRMVNSESDYLPGLIIDRFEDRYSIQIFSVGMELFKNDIVEILKENFKAKFIIEKNDNELRVLEGLSKEEKILLDYTDSDDKTFVLTIDDIKYKLDLQNGQKTGFYLDQAANRKLIREYVREGDDVLDLFCNEGGFALNAAYAKAESVIAVDSSEHAIIMSNENAKLNKFKNIEFICKDVFEFYNDIFQDSKRYDVIILDPPSFTKNKKNVIPALKGYEELNYKAMRLLKPNGILFTFSCSHHIDERNFEIMLMKAASAAKKRIKILDMKSTSYDHPVLPSMGETKYLKSYVLNVS
ncbi:MAG: class I SAM-dependent rRNA methyltransferase [Bacteroidetes bacterium]|nr:class I SAM-dependent rRNA methyltransferase [Bacteroidota bacterium]